MSGGRAARAAATAVARAGSVDQADTTAVVTLGSTAPTGVADHGSGSVNTVTGMSGPSASTTVASSCAAEAIVVARISSATTDSRWYRTASRSSAITCAGSR